ncbi:putative inorganic phosphate cotransporter [Nephila pilipes]|uniref:Putative inorganic phosphate cotransporter n=1 Tax=Nephila pilipes TaxID=299642 RepID=A0A8X6QJ38_NEPPI|nr:putative inorganic phosphate cotransporter [Nephila pilipes]
MLKETYKTNDSYGHKKYSENQINNHINKLDITFSDNHLYQNGSSDKIIQQKDAPRSFFQYRYLVALLQFFGYFEINAFRLVTSISVVAMVNNTAVDSHKTSNVSVLSCPFNVSNSGENLPQNSGEFDWSPAVQGYILGAGFLGYVVTQMPGGMLAESYGAKFTVLFGIFLSSLGHILSPFAARSSSYLLIAMQLLRGLGQGLISPAQCVIAANWFPSNERGLLNPLIMSGYSVGSLVGGFSSGAMCSSSFLGGWPSVYYVYGALGLLLCLCVQLFMYESPKCHPNIKDSELNYILQNQESDLSQKRPPTPWRKIFSSVPFYAVSYAIFSAFWTGSHFLAVQPIFLGTMLHFSIKENGILTSLPFAFQVALTFIGSCTTKWLNSNNYVGVDKLRKGFNFLYCLGYSLCLLGVIYSGCERMLSTVLSVAAMSFIGFSFNGCMITPVDMSPTFAGTLMGLSNTISSVAAFVFPVIVGIMTNEEQTLGQWNKIFVMCIGITMTSGILFCIFGSADVQPWNFSSEEDSDKTRSNNKELGEIGQPADVVIHL